MLTESREIVLTVSAAYRKDVYAHLRCAEVVVVDGIPIVVVLLVVSVVIVGTCELNLDVPANNVCVV